MAVGDLVRTKQPLYMYGKNFTFSKVEAERGPYSLFVEVGPSRERGCRIYRCVATGMDVVIHECHLEKADEAGNDGEGEKARDGAGATPLERE